jgi:hypothetical protein
VDININPKLKPVDWIIKNTSEVFSYENL